MKTEQDITELLMLKGVDDSEAVQHFLDFLTQHRLTTKFYNELKAAL